MFRKTSSQSFKSYESNIRPLDAGDFDTSCDEGTGELIVNKCPGNQIPLSQEYSKKTGKLNFILIQPTASSVV